MQPNEFKPLENRSGFNPNPETLYLCDNGACYCGAHLGASASMTGRDISGQRVSRVTAKDAADHEMLYRQMGRVDGDVPPLTCERPRCGRYATVIASPDGSAATAVAS